MSKTQGYRRFTCPDLWKNEIICGRQFKNMGDLTRHRLIHSGIKAHVCGECGKAFTQRSQLKTHHISRHTTDRPYQCDMCLNTFPDPSSRTRHCKEQHEGAYICPEEKCRGRIVRKGKFKKHLVEHGIQFSDVDGYFVRCNPPRRERVAAAEMRKPRVGSPHANEPFPSSIDPRQINLPKLYPIESGFSSSQMSISHYLPLPSLIPAHEFQASLAPRSVIFDGSRLLHKDLSDYSYSIFVSPPSPLSSSPEPGCLALQGYPSDVMSNCYPSDEFYPSALSFLPYEPYDVHTSSAWECRVGVLPPYLSSRFNPYSPLGCL